jgi:hypothetical protein
VRAVLAAARGVPLLEVVDAIERALVATAQAQRPIHRWLIELRTAAAYQDRYREQIDTFVAELAAFLDQRDDVRFADTRAAAFALAHGIEGVVQAVVARAPVDVPPIARAACDMVRAYIAANPPESR